MANSSKNERKKMEVISIFILNMLGRKRAFGEMDLDFGSFIVDPASVQPKKKQRVEPPEYIIPGGWSYSAKKKLITHTIDTPVILESIPLEITKQCPYTLGSMRDILKHLLDEVARITARRDNEIRRLVAAKNSSQPWLTSSVESEIDKVLPEWKK
jgi:hypothetical protein